MATYCTVSDLAQLRSTESLAKLAYDGKGLPDINDSGVQEVLARFITDASNEVRSHLLGRVTLEDDSGVIQDEQIRADCRRYTQILTLYALYKRRGHFGPENPYLDDAKHVRSELQALRKAERTTGSTPTPNRCAEVITDDNPASVFGRDSKFQRGW